MLIHDQRTSCLWWPNVESSWPRSLRTTRRWLGSHPYPKLEEKDVLPPKNTFGSLLWCASAHFVRVVVAGHLAATVDILKIIMAKLIIFAYLDETRFRGDLETCPRRRTRQSSEFEYSHLDQVYGSNFSTTTNKSSLLWVHGNVTNIFKIVYIKSGHPIDFRRKWLNHWVHPPT